MEAAEAKKIKEFLDENTAKYILYRSGEEIKKKENVPVLIMQQSSILIFENEEYTVIPWDSLIEVVLPLTEKAIKAAMITSDIMDEQFKMLSRKSTSGEHQYG